MEEKHVLENASRPCRYLDPFSRYKLSKIKMSIDRVIDVTYFFSWKWVVNSKKKADSASAAELCIGLPLGIGQCAMCEREGKVNRRKLWFTSTCDISKTIARIEIKQNMF